MKPPTYCNGAKIKLQTKIAKKEKKMYAISLWNIFIFNTCFTTYLLLFAIRIYGSCQLFDIQELTKGQKSNKNMVKLQHFGPYGQLRAVKEKSSIMSYELLFSCVFYCFHREFFCVCTQKLHLYLYESEKNLESILGGCQNRLPYMIVRA